MNGCAAWFCWMLLPPWLYYEWLSHILSKLVVLWFHSDFKSKYDMRSEYWWLDIIELCIFLHLALRFFAHCALCARYGYTYTPVYNRLIYYNKLKVWGIYGHWEYNAGGPLDENRGRKKNEFRPSSVLLDFGWISINCWFRASYL